MTDLLDQLAEVNPVPRCDPPSIDDVWRKLDALGDERGEDVARGRGLAARGLRVLPALVGVAVCLVVVIVAVTGPRAAHSPSGGGVGSALRSTPGWNANDGQHPALSALMAHFAVLRRPATAAERAARSRFAVGIGAGDRSVDPTLVRRVGDADGIPVYLVVYAEHRHGATGPVSGYTMTIDAADGGIIYAAGNYTIFPATVTTASEERRSVYLSVVPDGVRTVRWRFACQANARGCVLPGGQRMASVPVHGNLAVLPLPTLNPGTFDAPAVSVTWDRDDGTQTTYTNQTAAVPFAGAPAWPAGRPSPPQREAPANGPAAGASLAHWRAEYGVLRRPQDELDRSAVAKAGAAATVAASPLVASLTRVVLDTRGALVFITLSAVDPGAKPADRRYVARVWTAAPGSGQSAQSRDLDPGVQLPLSQFVRPGAVLQYSVVPDDVAKVSWPYTCSAGCGQLPASPLVLGVHDNVAYAFVTADAWSIQDATWYRRSGRAPLRFGP